MADQGSSKGSKALSELATAGEVDQAPERPTGEIIRALASYIGMVFLVGALIAPWVYLAVQQFAPESSLSEQPFHRYVNRCLLILALAGLYPLIRQLGISGVRSSGFGLRRKYAMDFAVGFVFGFGTLAIALAFGLAAGARTLELDHSGAAWLKHLKNAALAAVFAGFIEELLFRGAIFGGIRRQENFWKAALISSVFYGIVHFFERPVNPSEIRWNSGLLILGQMLRGFSDWQALVPGLLNLTLIGVILCLAFERRKSLLFPFGLHAGLIFWVKMTSFVSEKKESASGWVWGSDKLVDGWLTFALLLALFTLFQRTIPERREHDTGAMG